MKCFSTLGSVGVLIVGAAVSAGFASISRPAAPAPTAIACCADNCGDCCGPACEACCGPGCCEAEHAAITPAKAAPQAAAAACCGDCCGPACDDCCGQSCGECCGS